MSSESPGGSTSQNGEGESRLVQSARLCLWPGAAELVLALVLMELSGGTGEHGLAPVSWERPRAPVPGPASSRDINSTRYSGKGDVNVSLTVAGGVQLHRRQVHR